MMISCLIIDDEPLARKRLYSLVLKRPELHYIGEAATGKSAIQMINDLKPALIFLDIKMKDCSGFEVLKDIDVKPPMVIFVTAFDTYAVKAFDLFAIDYLLKPYKQDRFNASVDKALSYVNQQNQTLFEAKLNDLLKRVEDTNSRNSSSTFKNKLAVKTGKSVSFIDTKSITYITASRSYIDVFTTDNSYVLRDSLNNIINDISPDDFCRIHRSTVVNINFINKLIHSNYGEVDVKMKDDALFRIGHSYKKMLYKKLGIK
ncbi:LytTR family DNA-binding domain-containing protein [Oceanihabitans sediminis]|uniref:LytR/AlgR family response regulator transcription factor n=1 Tax=Flavobacteriaceae TaxID=49546 RepID=UPI00299F4ABF|nr:LytTR family DNA-binding domain-containing protein [Oceanihabitans sediminis]MDX1279418.1 LytTR family DNA-binding domain-containing protein [Oceanihabitans sediminis]